MRGFHHPSWSPSGVAPCVCGCGKLCLRSVLCSALAEPFVWLEWIYRWCPLILATIERPDHTRSVSVWATPGLWPCTPKWKARPSSWVGGAGRWFTDRSWYVEDSRVPHGPASHQVSRKYECYRRERSRLLQCPRGTECSGGHYSASQINLQLLWSVEPYHEDAVHVTTLAKGLMG